MDQAPSRYCSTQSNFEVTTPSMQPQMSPNNASEPRKRRRVENPASPSASPIENEGSEFADSVDLTDVAGQPSLSKFLAKQREDAVAAQKTSDNEKSHSILTAYRCPVCMETPVDATSTVCGHLFCHKCIIDTLKFSEERAEHSGKTPRGTCPVCRKPLSRIDIGPKRNLIPLQIKLHTRKRNVE